jgi:parvulin-like peptidyl-prolyl cis-trans isomerase-like protein
MGRAGLIVVVLALAGCSALRDAFSAHPQFAGTAAGQTLTVERLANLVGHAQRIPIRPDVLTGLANIYLDYALFAAALGHGRDLHDSALVLAAEWPVVAQLKWERYHEQLLASRGRLTPAQADSAYEAGTVRLFQHILIRIPQSAVPMVEQQKEKQAAGVLRQAAAQPGASFAQLARRYSEDPGSKVRGGYLPATPRGQFVPAFDSAAWTLPPGAMTGVVRTPFGFHLIRRPPLAEVRDSFRVDLENSRSTRFDSLYLDSLAKQRQLKLESGAPARMRQAVPQIVSARSDRRTLATYRGGTFQVKDLARWLLALDPNDVRGISTASDAQLNQFLKVLAQREMLLVEVDKAGVQLTPGDWRQLRAEHDSGVARLEGLLGISPQMLKDSAATPAARVQLAMAHVDRYVDRAVAQGSAPFFPVPPFLAGALRQGEPWSLNEAGLARALESAQAIRARDTTGGGRAGSPPPTGLKPAPGPPPVAADSGGRQAPR